MNRLHATPVHMLLVLEVPLLENLSVSCLEYGWSKMTDGKRPVMDRQAPAVQRLSLGSIRSISLCRMSAIVKCHCKVITALAIKDTQGLGASAF